MKLFIKVVLMLCFALNLMAAKFPSTWYSYDDKGQVKLNVSLYISSKCPHCHRAEDYLKDLAQKNPWIKINRFMINEDKEALKHFDQELKKMNSYDFSVPTVMFCDSKWVGFLNVPTTGKRWFQALDYCREKIKQKGELPTVVINTLRQWSDSENITTATPIYEPSALSIIFNFAVIEAYSPCALFCFALFLAFIWLYPTRKGKQFISAMTFIVIIGLLKLLQQINNDFYTTMIANFRWFALAVGVVICKFAFNNYIAKKQKLGANSLWLPSLIFGTIAVFAYQQQCAVQYGMVFEQWVHSLNINPMQYFLYHVLYTVFYLASLCLLMLFYLTFGVHPHNIFYNTACILLAVIGVLLVAYPVVLTSMWLSVLVCVGALLCGWLWARHSS